MEYTVYNSATKCKVDHFVRDTYDKYTQKQNRALTIFTLLNTQISPLAVGFGTPCPL